MIIKSAVMDALRMKVDGLQWEINRLDAENHRLREENPDADERVDLEAKLQQAKSDIVGMSEPVQMYEKQLEELRVSAETRTVDAKDHKETARNLDQMHEELRVANDSIANEQVTAGVKAKVASLKATVTNSGVSWNSGKTTYATSKGEPSKREKP